MKIVSLIVQVGIVIWLLGSLRFYSNELKKEVDYTQSCLMGIHQNMIKIKEKFDLFSSLNYCYRLYEYERTLRGGRR